MRLKPPSSSLNLPVLLSFNELAWIAVFGMSLACAYTWSLTNDKIIMNREDHRNLTNRLAQCEAVCASLSNHIAELYIQTNELGRLLAAESVQARAYSNWWRQSVEQVAQLSNDLRLALVLPAQLSNRIAVLQQANADLAAQLAEESQALRKARQEAADAIKLIADLLGETNRLWAWIGSLKPVPQELLNLQGGLASNNMENVVFLLDRSGSMAKGGRWTNAIEVVSTWLRHLPIKRCALVTFSDQVDQFPEPDTWADVSGPQGGLVRTNLLNQLNNLDPQGYTSTLKALQVAYGYTNVGRLVRPPTDANGPFVVETANPGFSVDTIILFTDGKPELPKPGTGHASIKESEEARLSRDSVALMDAIHALCQSKKGIPVNTVAIGDYFDRRLADFLLQVAKETGGTFLGR